MYAGWSGLAMQGSHLPLYWVHHDTANTKQQTNIAKFANSIDPDEAAHDEPHHLDLHCLLSI